MNDYNYFQEPREKFRLKQKNQIKKNNKHIYLPFEYQKIICNNLTMKSSYLKGNIICALPQLKDIFFSRSIIYITHHNKDGAVGIVLNYKVLNIKGSELFRKLNIKEVNHNLDTNFTFHIGGPLNQNNGFILHSSDYKSEFTLNVSKKSKTYLLNRHN